MPNDLIEVPLAGFLKDSDKGIFQTVDDVVSRSLATGDPLIALEFARSMQREGLLRGLAIAKLMYKIKQNWNLFEVAGVGDTFESIVQTQNGYAPETVEKYIRMWEGIFENPHIDEELKHQLSGRPIGDLLLLTAAAREGSLSESDWEKVSVAPDSHSVRAIVRKARGEVTSSKTAVIPQIQMRPDGTFPRGALYVYENGTPVLFGSIDVDTTSEAAKKAIARIINGAHIKET